MASKKKQGLLPRQFSFVQWKKTGLSNTQAALKAGYSTKSAGGIGYQLMQKTAIKEAIEKDQQALEERTNLTQDDVVQRLIELAFTNIDSFAEWIGGRITIRSLDDIPANRIGALQEIAETRDGLRIRMADRMPALTLLARYLRLLPTPGSKEDPLQHEHLMKGADLDLSTLSDEQLEQLGDALGAIVAAQEIAAGGTG